MAIGTAFGILLGLAQLSRAAPVAKTAWFVTHFFRNAPWLVLLFYCMFLLPFKVTLFGVTIPLPDWVKATFGLSLPVMANMSEIVRGAVQSIPTGQWESASSFAFSRRQTHVDDHPAAVHQADAAAVDEPLLDPDGRHRSGVGGRRVGGDDPRRRRCSAPRIAPTC